jgi:hypothetical protein
MAQRRGFLTCDFYEDGHCMAFGAVGLIIDDAVFEPQLDWGET